MKVSHWLALMGLAFALALGVVAGMRMEQEALTVMMGVGCGVGAGIPTGLLVWMVARGRERRGERATFPAAPASPPVVVIAPPGGQPRQSRTNWSDGYPAAYPETPSSAPRQFLVIGEDEEVEPWVR